MAITATMAEAQNDYYKAMRAGKREGEILPNLDDILKEKNIVAVREVPLGLVQIPSELIVGTKTAGRSSAFSKSFKPLLKENTEFAYKWMALYKAHLNEGIREPIKAYEFMNKFYVEEGNKRVSVLKFFDAVSIPGNVTRIVPPRTEEKENKITCEICQAAAKEESGFGRKVSEATESSPEKRQHAPVEKFFHYSGSFGPGTVYRWKCDAEEGNRTDTVWLHERGKGTGR